MVCRWASYLSPLNSCFDFSNKWQNSSTIFRSCSSFEPIFHTARCRPGCSRNFYRISCIDEELKSCGWVFLIFPIGIQLFSSSSSGHPCVSSVQIAMLHWTTDSFLVLAYNYRRMYTTWQVVARVCGCRYVSTEGSTIIIISGKKLHSWAEVFLSMGMSVPIGFLRANYPLGMLRKAMVQISTL